METAETAETAEEAAREDGAGLLEGSIGYASAALGGVTAGALRRPTPCRGWDLGMLLAHTGESLAALAEAADTRAVRLTAGPQAAPGPARDPAAALVAALRLAASRLLGAWRAAAASPVSVGGEALPAGVVAATGALEIAVHGWDIARATGRPRPLPDALAARLLEIAPALVTGATRPGLFAPPVAVPSAARPGDRLVAFLGRDPDWDRGRAQARTA